MPTVKITKRTVDAAKPQARELFLWDTDVAGFGLRVRPSGHKTYLIQYRIGGRNTTPQRMAIGNHGTLTAAQARARAKELLGLKATGKDPVGERRKARQASTIADLADRYLTDHAEKHKAAASVKSDRVLIENVIKPRIGKIHVPAISRADVARMHHQMRATPYHANRALAVVSKMLNLAEAWGLRPDWSNPCRHVKRYQESKRERFFSSDELQAIGAAIAKAEADNTEQPACLLALRLLALTGMRASEPLSLKWSDVDLQRQVAFLRTSKTGARKVALGAAAVALLDAIPERDRGDYVVPALTRGQPLPYATLDGAWRRIRKAAGIPDARMHDFRHTVGTHGGQLAPNAFMVQHLLGHTTIAMTSRYVERDADPLNALADQVSNRIAGAMKGDKAEVIAIKGVKRG
ncbi:MAG: tyrosine-type recombinase/integrase [Alphaproteobacteria bacterium]